MAPGDGRPPDRRGQPQETNLRQAIRGLIRDATVDEESLRRHLKVFRFFRSTILVILTAVLLGAMLFGAGIAAAVAIAGIRLPVAVGIGAMGSGTFVLTVAVKMRRYLKVLVNALSAADFHALENQPPADQAGSSRP
jgi:hypothetical protein